jgi:hypothetical protein
MKEKNKENERKIEQLFSECKIEVASSDEIEVMVISNKKDYMYIIKNIDRVFQENKRGVANIKEYHSAQDIANQVKELPPYLQLN